MLSTTTTDCSEAQIIPLSKDFDISIEETAILISAVSSITAEVLPGPTPKAGLPDEYAALTIPGPPVAKIQSMLGCFIKALESSIDGTSIQPIISSGAPAFTAASRTIFAASIVHFLALGCGEKIIPFLVFKAIKDLKIAVEVGFVVGTIPAKTPKGSATILIPLILSSLIIPQVFAFLCLL